MIDSALFAKVAIFSELDPPHLDALSRVASTRPYAAGEAILREDEPGDLFFVIVRGQVKVFVDSEHGREVVLTHLKTGDFFGEMALFDNETRSASVSALVPSELIVLRRKDFLDVLADVSPATFCVSPSTRAHPERTGGTPSRGRRTRSSRTRSALLAKP